MRTGWFIALAAAFYLFVVALFWPIERLATTPTNSAVDAAGYQHGTIVFSDSSVRVQIPTTPAAQQLGLGGRTHLSDTEGMFWIYDEPQRPTFWMHGMLIPLDFVWTRDNTIVDLLTNVAAPSDPSRTDLPTIQPMVAATGVLEVAAGYVNRHGLAIGDSAIIEPAR